MVFYEGQEIKPCDFTFECYNHLIESYYIQREIRKTYTDTCITINTANNQGLLNENNMNRLTTNTGAEIFNKLISILKVLAKILDKLFKDFIILLKQLMAKDNSALLKMNRDKYDSIPIDLLDDMRYTWREPTSKLLNIIKDGTNTENDIPDLTEIFNVSFEYTAKAKGYIAPVESSDNIIFDMTNKLLNTGGVYDLSTFKRSYTYTLLQIPVRECGISYERKCQIRDGLISKKVIHRIETSSKEQQKAIERHIKIIEKIKDSEQFDLQVINHCRETVNTLNNIAIAVSNSIIESVHVYTNQCRDMFNKILHYANWHDNPII